MFQLCCYFCSLNVLYILLPYRFHHRSDRVLDPGDQYGRTEPVKHSQDWVDEDPHGTVGHHQAPTSWYASHRGASATFFATPWMKRSASSSNFTPRSSWSAGNGNGLTAKDSPSTCMTSKGLRSRSISRRS